MTPNTYQPTGCLLMALCLLVATPGCSIPIVPFTLWIGITPNLAPVGSTPDGNSSGKSGIGATTGQGGGTNGSTTGPKSGWWSRWLDAAASWWHSKTTRPQGAADAARLPSVRRALVGDAEGLAAALAGCRQTPPPHGVYALDAGIPMGQRARTESAGRPLAQRRLLLPRGSPWIYISPGIAGFVPMGPAYAAAHLGESARRALRGLYGSRTALLVCTRSSTSLPLRASGGVVRATATAGRAVHVVATG